MARHGEDELTEWVNIAAFGKQADVLMRHSKGDLLAAMGVLTKSRWKGRDGEPRVVLADLRTRHARKKELRRWNADRVLELVRSTRVDHRMVNAELNRRSGVDRVGEADEAALRRRLRAADDWLESLRG